MSGAPRKPRLDAEELVWKTLAFHVGASCAVSAQEVADETGLTVGIVCGAIRALRVQGRLILAAGGRYYLAADRGEWEEFRDRALRPQARSLVDVIRAMTLGAERRWSHSEVEHDR